MAPPSPRVPTVAPAEDDEEEGAPLDVSYIQSFADKIQRAPQELSGTQDVSRPKITIPKRGEKDFEPLQETVKLQEMMLLSSRQALFDALQGVRGVSSKGLSHAIVTPASPFPQLLVSRGHVLDSLGITTRRTNFQGRLLSRVELLPEEALYLVERGSLQIWNGREPNDEEEEAAGIGAWSDAQFGVKGAIEMSVLEVFGTYLGQEGLTWYRYQTYASLKRLGYTVQRTPQFIPHSLRTGWSSAGTRSVVQTAWKMLRKAGRQLLVVLAAFAKNAETVMLLPSIALRRLLRPTLEGTILSYWHGQTYTSMFATLRLVPASHHHTRQSHPTDADKDHSIYHPLVNNPYLPFFHVWKPITPWSKTKWDRGSPLGLAQQPPDYTIAAVESRNTPLPTLRQLNEIFPNLRDEPKGPTRRIGPQYERSRPFPRSVGESDARKTWYQRIIPSGFLQHSSSPSSPSANPVAVLRNGDRALTVAVNDSGNTGWIRFGRSDFADFAMV